MNNFSISPWKLTWAWSSAGYIRTIKDAQGEHIAHVCDLEDSLTECTANARLMAAAPDLLQALRLIAAETTYDGTERDTLIAHIQGYCREAIAKATGSQTETI